MATKPLAAFSLLVFLLLAPTVSANADSTPDCDAACDSQNNACTEQCSSDDSANEAPAQDEAAEDSTAMSPRPPSKACDAVYPTGGNISVSVNPILGILAFNLYCVTKYLQPMDDLPLP
jgi:hypothetical protein